MKTRALMPWEIRFLMPMDDSDSNYNATSPLNYKTKHSILMTYIINKESFLLFIKNNTNLVPNY